MYGRQWPHTQYCPSDSLKQQCFSGFPLVLTPSRSLSHCTARARIRGNGWHFALNPIWLDHQPWPSLLTLLGLFSSSAYTQKAHKYPQHVLNKPTTLVTQEGLNFNTTFLKTREAWRHLFFTLFDWRSLQESERFTKMWCVYTHTHTHTHTHRNITQPLKRMK